MGVNKVIYDGDTLIDLTEDSVTPSSLAEGATAHDSSGNVIRGTMPTTSVLYTEQTLSDAQKTQARHNIGADAVSFTTSVSDGNKIAELTINGTVYSIHVPKLTATHDGEGNVTLTYE